MDNDSVSSEDIGSLMRVMSKVVYTAKDNSTSVSLALEKCLHYFDRDYEFTVATNGTGELCAHYPQKIVLIEGEKRCHNGDCPSIVDYRNGDYGISSGTEDEDDDSSIRLPPAVQCSRTMRLTQLFTKARFARCWTRFVVPIIFLNGKHICRSATTSSGKEIYGRWSWDLLYTGGQSIPEESDEAQTNGNWQLFDRIRGQDIKLLKEFKIKYICDLMVENKKVKYFCHVTSSEKADKEQRYADFSVWSMPYPGCEFFRVWRDHGYAGEQSFYDWEQDCIDTTLDIPAEYAAKLPIDWKNYKSWDIVKLTQNYLKLLLHVFREGDSGLLVHCISGWDRTPLFVTLLRLTLWADGLIHKSLSPKEILYLTIAYDWFMFGHDLPDRLSKGEDIFLFTFHFLRYIQDDDFTTTSKSLRRARAASGRTEAEWLDTGGILLEGDPMGKYGSSASLCSNSSVLSRGSAGGADGCPQQRSSFNGTDDADDVLVISSSYSNGVGGSDDGTVGQLLSASTDTVAPSVRDSTPVAVPIRLQSDSPCAAGSWQMISGNGSFWESCKSSSSGTAASLPDVPEHGAETYTPRKARLDEVRRLFCDAYESVIGFSNNPSSTGGGISSLLGYIADKVGAKK